MIVLNTWPLRNGSGYEGKLGMSEKWLAPDDTVRVLDEDIAEGIRANQFNCAIVCAIQRKYPEAKRVRVNSGTIAFSIGEERRIYPTPEVTVETMIKPFDRAETPTPGIVRLKGGIAKEVIHGLPQEVNAAKRRERRIQRRAGVVRKPDRDQKTAEYMRFAPDE